LRRVRSAIPLIVATIASGAAGCGGEDDYENRPRPAAPINVTAAITGERVSVSPETFGAGPIVLIVSNQSDSEQELTVETEEIAGEEPGVRQTSTPIRPGGTGNVQVDLREGTYAVGVGDAGIAPATVEVSGKRASAQDELLQP
jgi:hypothetical protein